MLQLWQDVGHKLRENGFRARGIQITIRDNKLGWNQWQAPVEVPTQSPLELAKWSRVLFEARYDWHLPIRAVTVRSINLIPSTYPIQTILFDDPAKRDKRERIEDAIEEIRARFGNNAIRAACLMGNLKMPGPGIHEVNMPGLMYR